MLPVTAHGVGLLPGLIYFQSTRRVLFSFYVSCDAFARIATASAETAFALFAAVCRNHNLVVGRAGTQCLSGHLPRSVPIDGFCAYTDENRKKRDIHVYPIISEQITPLFPCGWIQAAGFDIGLTVLEHKDRTQAHVRRLLRATSGGILHSRGYYSKHDF